MVGQRSEERQFPGPLVLASVVAAVLMSTMALGHAQPVSSLACRPGESVSTCEKAITKDSAVRQRSRGPATEARIFETVYLATGFLAYPSLVQRTELNPQADAEALEFVLVMPSSGELWLLVGRSGLLHTVYRKTPVPVDRSVATADRNPHVQDRLKPFLDLRADFMARCNARPVPAEQRNVFRLEGQCGPWSTVFEYTPETDAVWWKYTE